MLGSGNEQLRGKKQNGVCAITRNSVLLIKRKAQGKKSKR